MAVKHSGKGGSSSSVSNITVNGKSGPSITVTKSDVGLASCDNTSDINKPISSATQAAIDAEHTAMVAQIALCLKTADKGANNGVASLDSTGQLSSSQIPSSLLAGLKWQGTWDVAGSTPTIPTAATGNNGWFYRASTAGTSSITGSSLSYAIGDWLISNGTAWQRVANTFSDATTSTKGVVQLAGDFGGTAASPTVAKVAGVTVPSAAPTAARQMMMSSSTSALQYDVIKSADLPQATASAVGGIKIAGDIGGTYDAVAVKKIDGWTVDNAPTGLNQALTVSDISNKKLAWTAQSGGSGITTSIVKVNTSTAQSAIGPGTVIQFNSVEASLGSAIVYDSATYSFLLRAGYTYYLRAELGELILPSLAANLQWRTGNVGGSGTFIGTMGEVIAPTYSSTNAQSIAAPCAIYTPSTDTYVHLEVKANTITTQAGYPSSAIIETISGSAPVTGQSVDYLEATATGGGSSSVTNGSYVQYAVSSSQGGVSYSSGIITLSAGKTYELKAQLQSVGDASFQFYNITTSSLVGTPANPLATTSSNGSAPAVIASALITPSVTTQIAMKNTSGATAVIYNPNCWLSVKQIGTSSVIQMVGASSTVAGVAGTVPAPALGDQNKFLKADGTYSPSQITFDVTKAYSAGDIVYVGGVTAKANGSIAANTTFAWGTTGATWSPVIPSSSTTFTWKGVVAASTAYSANDLIAIGSGISSGIYWVTAGYTSTSTPANDFISGGVAAGSVLGLNWGLVNASTYTMVGATTSTSGRKGDVPAPAANTQNRALRGDATYAPLAAPWALTNAYKSGDLAIVNGGTIIQANGDITSNTAFAWGTTGATWSPILPNTYTWKGIYAAGTSYAVNDVAVNAFNMYCPLMVCVVAHTGVGSIAGTARVAGNATTGSMAPFLLGVRTDFVELQAITPTATAPGATGLLPAASAGTQNYPLRGGGVPRQSDYALYALSGNQGGVTTGTVINIIGTAYALRGDLTTISTVSIVLKANRTYRLNASFSGDVGAGGDTRLQFYNVTSSAYIGNYSFMYPTSGTGNGSGSGCLMAYIAPTVDTTIQVRCNFANVTTTIYGGGSFVEVMEI